MAAVVSFHAARVVESPGADGAGVRRLAGVYPRVHDQIALFGESLLANGARVWLLAGVRHRVVLQVLVLTKRLAANVAHILTYPVVDQSVLP